jgi:GDPmannose 4,6-dehydratase
VDWGAAQDYVRAMRLTLQQHVADDYIIATGIPHTVRDFAEEAFAFLGLCAEDFVYQDQSSSWTERLPYIGDSSMIRKTCAWEPLISFKNLVRGMVEAHLQQMKGSS